MIATIAAPESLPEALQYLVYGGAIFVSIAVALWRAFRWLLARIDDQFKAAIRSDDFERVVDKRVAAAFEGATAPILQAYKELAKDVGHAQKTAEKAHARLDRFMQTETAE